MKNRIDLSLSAQQTYLECICKKDKKRKKNVPDISLFPYKNGMFQTKTFQLDIEAWQKKWGSARFFCNIIIAFKREYQLQLKPNISTTLLKLW